MGRKIYFGKPEYGGLMNRASFRVVRKGSAGRDRARKPRHKRAAPAMLCGPALPFAALAILLSVFCIAPAQSISSSASGLTATSIQSAGALPELGNDGAFRYDIPLELPAARGGRVTPQVSLAYGSGPVNSLLGKGWQIPQRYIERDVPFALGSVTVGPGPADFIGTDFIAVSGSVRRRLVRQSSGDFRAEVEDQFLRYSRTPTGWRAVDGWGTEYRFDLEVSAGAFERWYLTEVVDVNGSRARHEYRTIARPGCVSGRIDSLPIPLRIDWNEAVGAQPSAACAAGNFKDRLEFVYTARPDSWPHVDPTGFTLLSELLAEIRHVSLGQRMRTWHLRYRQSTTNRRSLLSAIDVSGRGCIASVGGSADTPLACPPDQLLPSTTFRWSNGPAVFEPSPTAMSDNAGALADAISFLGSIDYDAETPLYGGIFEDRAGLVDLDGDGRSDRLAITLVTPGAPSTHQWSWRRSQAGSPGVPVGQPFVATQNIGGATTENSRPDGRDLIDLDGDGRVDHISGWTVRWGTNSGLGTATSAWDGAGTQSWLSANPHNQLPSSVEIGWCTPVLCRARQETRISGTVYFHVLRAMVDLTGDGVVDYVVAATNQPSIWWVFPGFLEPVAAGAPSRGGFRSTPLLWPVPFDGINPYLPIELALTEVIGRGPDARQYAVAGLVDFNGDGLLDYWYQRGIFLNTGRGFVSGLTIASSLSRSILTGGEIRQEFGVHDVNGDGLPDQLRTQSMRDGNRLEVAYNQGTGFGVFVPWLETSLYARSSMLVGRWTGPRQARSQRAGLADLTGDGLLDYVAETSPGTWQVHQNPGGSGGTALPDELVAVRNGIGGGFSIAYAPTSGMSGVRLPTIRHLVSQISPILTTQGVVVPAPTRYTFGQGELTRDPARGTWTFRGFATVTAARVGGNSTVTTYGISDPDLAYRPTMIEQRDRIGCRFTRTTIEYGKHQPAGSNVRIVHQRSVLDERFGGSICATSSLGSRREVLALDDFGNVTRRADLGDAQRADDDLYESTTYAQGTRVVSAPARTRLCADRACTRPVGETIRRYDGVLERDTDALPEGSVDRGLLKIVNQVVYDVSVPGNPPIALFDTERYSYDPASGNRITSALMLNAIDGKRTREVWDTTWGLYVVSRRSGLGVPGGRPALPLDTTLVVDLPSGLVTLETGPDGVAIEQSYDPFGRPMLRSRLYGAQRDLLTSWKYRFFAQGAEQIVQHHWGTTASIDQHQLFDGLGRFVRSFTPLGPAATGRDRIDEELRYDVQGRIAVRLEAHETDRRDPMAQYHHYDDRGRVNHVIRTPLRANGAIPAATENTNLATSTFVTRYRYAIGSGAMVISEVGPRHSNPLVAYTPRVTRLDARDRLVATIDPLGRRVDYRYDLLGHLAGIERTLTLSGDSCTGSVCDTSIPVRTTMTWDSLGQRHSLLDPDKGSIRDYYDFAGNRVRSERAGPRSNVHDIALVWSYDLHGRVERHYGERRVNGVWVRDPEVDATYVYDMAPAGHPSATYLAGRLAQMVDPTGTTWYGYDPAGRVAYEGKTLPGALGTHFIRRTYRTDGFLSRVDYDGRESVEYSYNSAGWLENVYTREPVGSTWRTRSYYEVDRFGPLGRPELVFRADRYLWERQEYHQKTGQLTSIEVGGPTPAATGPLLNFVYDKYDAIGNLTEMRDRRTNTSIIFTYDEANQLTSALALRPTGGTGQSWQYRYVYDTLGNVRRRVDLIGSDDRIFGYADDGLEPHVARSHALSSSALPSPLIHDHGNLIRDEACQMVGGNPMCTPRRTFAYATDDRLVEVKEGFSRVSYAYDGRGDRAREERTGLGRPTTRHFISNLLEIEVIGNTTKVLWHVFAGGRRLLTKQDDAARSEEHALHDNLGSVRATTDRGGVVQVRADYLPHGRLDALTSSGNTRFGFTGRRGAGSLLDFGFRAYDPDLQRFLGADTRVPGADRAIAFNRYAYAFNNPVSMIDPDGHNPVLIAALFGAVIGGALGAIEAAQAGQPIWRGILIGAVTGAIGGATEGVFVLGSAQLGSLLASKGASVLASAVVASAASAIGGGLYSVALALGQDLIAMRPVEASIVAREFGLGAIQGLLDFGASLASEPFFVSPPLKGARSFLAKGAAKLVGTSIAFAVRIEELAINLGSRRVDLAPLQSTWPLAPAAPVEGPLPSAPLSGFWTLIPNAPANARERLEALHRALQF